MVRILIVAALVIYLLGIATGLGVLAEDSTWSDLAAPERKRSLKHLCVRLLEIVFWPICLLIRLFIFIGRLVKEVTNG